MASLGKLHKKFFLTIFFLLSNFSFNEAKAIVSIPLFYNRIAGTGTLEGTLVIDETSVTFGNFEGTGSALPSWISSITLLYDDGSGGAPENTYNASNFGFVRITKNEGVTVDFTQDLVPQLTDLVFLGKTGSDPGSAGFFTQDVNTSEFTLTSTPTPIPFLSLLIIPFSTSYIRKKFKKDNS